MLAANRAPLPKAYGARRTPCTEVSAAIRRISVMQRARATSGCAISRVDLSGLASIKLNRTNEDQPACYPSSDLKYCDDEVCILSNSGSTIFYHCLEELYKVVILERHEFGGRYVVAGMP